MKVTIAQPSFFPNLHLFKRIIDCDVWIVMESAQFVRRLPWAAHESCMIKDRSGKVAKIADLR